MNPTASTNPLHSSTHYSDAKRLLKIFIDAGFESMFAGGAVRDRLRGVEVKDYDIATKATPEEIIQVATSHGLKSIPTGIDHGTVTLLTTVSSYEVTTLRRDVETDGRHAKVVFDGASFQDDAMRRDFTMNALFEDHSGNIVDFVGGQEDIKNRVIRFVGDPSARIREDFLRILRCYRFWATLGSTPEARTLQATIDQKDGLKKVSKERIAVELDKLLAGDHAEVAVRSLAQHGLLASMASTLGRFPHMAASFETSEYDRLTSDQRQWFWLIKMGAHSLTNPESARDWAQALGTELKWSDRKTRILAQLITGFAALPKIATDQADTLLYVDGFESNDLRLDFLSRVAPLYLALISSEKKFAPLAHNLARIKDTEQQFGNLRKAKMPISGQDVLSTRPDLSGAQIGEALALLRRSFLNGEWIHRDDGVKRLRG